jgi:hypothetical protein
LEKKYKVDFKNWGNHKCLDLDVNPEGSIAWRERALGYLSADRPDIRRFLLWAEHQNGIITEADEKRGALEVGMKDDAEHVAYVSFEAVKAIMTDALLSRARVCGPKREARPDFESSRCATSESGLRFPPRGMRNVHGFSPHVGAVGGHFATVS